MFRAAAIVTLSVMCGSCDTLYSVSASGRTDALLGQTCVLETLRSESAVHSALAREHGTIAVELNIPESVISGPEDYPHPVIGVYMRKDRDGPCEIELTMLSVNRRPSAGYEAYIQKVLDELRNRIIERCGSS